MKKLNLVVTATLGVVVLSASNFGAMTNVALAEGVDYQTKSPTTQVVSTPFTLNARLPNLSSRSDLGDGVRVAGSCWCEDFRRICAGAFLNGVCQYFVNVCVQTQCSND
jgi:hypothetical protein